MLLVLLVVVVFEIVVFEVYHSHRLSPATRDGDTTKVDVSPPKSKTTNIESVVADAAAKPKTRPKDFDENSPAVRVLRKAGVEITDELKASLPTSAEIEELYGEQPVILGLDQCQSFRDAVKPEDSFIAVAGIFNTGTNLLSQFLQDNCVITEKFQKLGKPGIRGQVAWGKHTPVDLRETHKAKEGINIDIHATLPILVVKDPYTWMQSMCRHHYAALWYHDESRCPNLVPVTDGEKRNLFDKESVPVSVKYSATNTRHHKSLVDFWNTWYGDWMSRKDDFPYLVVRFEDLLFHAEEVIRKVCECGAGEIKDPDGFRYKARSAKGGRAHTGSNDLVGAMTRYGNSEIRRENFLGEDLIYAQNNLDAQLMKKLNYKFIA